MQAKRGHRAPCTVCVPFLFCFACRTPSRRSHALRWRQRERDRASGAARLLPLGRQESRGSQRRSQWAVYPRGPVTSAGLLVGSESGSLVETAGWARRCSSVARGAVDGCANALATESSEPKQPDLDRNHVVPLLRSRHGFVRGSDGDTPAIGRQDRAVDEPCLVAREEADSVSDLVGPCAVPGRCARS